MMVKKLLLVLFAFALIPFSLMADWVSIDKSKTANAPPNVTLMSHNNSSTVIKVDIAGFNISEFIAEGKTYQTVDLLTDIFTANPGSPELPYIAKVLAIPDQVAVSVEVIETGDTYTFENIFVPPARKSWYEGDPESPYLENKAAYLAGDVYPMDYVTVDPPSVFRDLRIARVSVFPVRYIPSEKELQVVSSITIKVNYGPGEVVNPKTSVKKKIAPSFGKLYRSSIFNYQEVLDQVYGGKEDGMEVMLCIMPDEFTESFQTYADWKHQSGTYIHVTKFSDIGANSNNPDIIKNHISDAYYDWENPPTYVLIIGDEGVFPHKIITYPDYSFPTEDYFVEIEGNDYFPEMMIGRFTNQGDYRMQVMINKYQLYEKTPYTDETDWFKSSTCCSNNAYDSQVSTVRFTANIMMEDGGFEVDTLMSDGTGWGGQNCSMDVYDVVNTINDGRSYLNYRGEGWYSGWSANCYYFDADHVSSLSNGQKFTFVTSIGCGVAGFHSYGGNCFGEEWIQLGSLTTPRGGVAFIGPTSNTHTTYNNRIDKGIYVGMFQEGMDTPGQALLRGKLYMYNVFGGEYYVEYHYRIYCVLGDPSIHIWKDVPLDVNVDHETSINVGNNPLEFTVTFASSGLPVANAEVCLAGNDVYATGVTDSDGYVLIEIFPAIEQEIVVTVRGGNVYPYQGTMLVGQPQQLVEPFGDPAIVDLDGNTDGLINPNENCEITYTLKNWGNLSASNVQATLNTADPDYVQIITTDPVSFGNLAPGNSFTGDPFQIFVKPECLVGQEITLQLHVESSSTSWDYDYTAVVNGCMLEYENFIVKDAGGAGNGNYRMDPDETVNLAFSVRNHGEDIAPNVLGVLMSTDPYITIEDPDGTFGTINMNDLSINMDDYFKVTVDASCPAEYWAQFSLKLYTVGGNYPYEVIPDFTLPVGIPISADYSGPDAYGYYAYASDDSFYEQTPAYNWVEIESIGTQMNVPLISDYTATVNLPFTFKYYDMNYNSLRISTDGWIAFGSGSEVAPVNTPLPNNDYVISMAAVFWDDLYDIDYLNQGKIYYYYDNTNHRFIVEWDSITHNNLISEPNPEDFQVILLDPAFYPTATGDGELIFQYKEVMDITSNTIGIENHAQNIGLQYVYDENYDATASEIYNEYAIKFTTEPPYVNIFTSVEGVPNSSGYTLTQNNPNPFSTFTWINYSIPESSKVVLNIYNIRGELISTLHNGIQSAGKYSIKWSGIDDSGHPVNSGIYFYRLQTDDFIETRKMFKLD